MATTGTASGRVLSEALAYIRPLAKDTLTVKEQLRQRLQLREGRGQGFRALIADVVIF